jgi:hypothetical protein
VVITVGVFVSWWGISSRTYFTYLKSRALNMSNTIISSLVALGNGDFLDRTAQLLFSQV